MNVTATFESEKDVLIALSNSIRAIMPKPGKYFSDIYRNDANMPRRLVGILDTKLDLGGLHVKLTGNLAEIIAACQEVCDVLAADCHIKTEKNTIDLYNESGLLIMPQEILIKI